jgi:hypothetical protein
MSKYRIVFEKNEEKTNEQEIIDDIQKNEFFDWLNKNGYSIENINDILEGKKISAGEQSRFNITLRKAKKEINISLTESIIFLEEFFTKFKKILIILDGETKFELKKELSINHKIKLDKSSLSQILG